jgi:hypothetical protein
MGFVQEKLATEQDSLANRNSKSACKGQSIKSRAVQTQEDTSVTGQCNDIHIWANTNSGERNKTVFLCDFRLPPRRR